MAILTKAQILSAHDLKTETVAVPQWGGEVIVQELTGGERDAFEQLISEKKQGNGSIDFKGIRATLVALSVVDESGQKIFTKDDIDELDGKSAKALDAIFEVSQKLSGMSKEAIEDAKKPLETTPADTSISN